MTFALQNKQEIRHQVGRNAHAVIISEVTDTKDTASLWDTYGLQWGGDDEYNGRQVMIYSAAGSIVDGEKSWVTDFVSTDKDATCTPAFTANLTDGDKYEMWEKGYRIEEVDDIINQAILDVTNRILVDRVVDSNYTEDSVYSYDWLTPYAFGNDFAGVYKVEYVKNTATEITLSDCDTVWTAGANVTATVDTVIEKEGSGCAKLVVDAAAAAGAVLGYIAITSVDLTDTDAVEFWIRSSIALTAGQLEIVLDDTAAVVSPTETLAVPAIAANTWTRVSVNLADVPSDSAIISVGIQQASGVDVGACTLYLDNILAVKKYSREWVELSPDHWFIVRGASPLFSLTSSGLTVVGANNWVRLSGYAAPDIFSDDTTDCEIDPAYVIAEASGQLLLAHSASGGNEKRNREDRAKYFLGKAAMKVPSMLPDYPGTMRWVS